MLVDERAGELIDWLGEDKALPAVAAATAKGDVVALANEVKEDAEVVPNAAGLNAEVVLVLLSLLVLVTLDAVAGLSPPKPELLPKPTNVVA